MEKDFVYERTKQLDKFCNEIVKCPHLYNSSNIWLICLTFLQLDEF